MTYEEVKSGLLSAGFEMRDCEMEHLPTLAFTFLHKEKGEFVFYLHRDVITLYHIQNMATQKVLNDRYLNSFDSLGQLCSQYYRGAFLSDTFK